MNILKVKFKKISTRTTECQTDDFEGDNDVKFLDEHSFTSKATVDRIRAEMELELHVKCYAGFLSARIVTSSP